VGQQPGRPPVGLDCSPFLCLPLQLPRLVSTSVALGGSWMVKAAWRVERVRAAWKAVSGG
jgi:hypothetical protein